MVEFREALSFRAGVFRRFELAKPIWRPTGHQSAQIEDSRDDDHDLRGKESVFGALSVWRNGLAFKAGKTASFSRKCTWRFQD